MASIQTVSTAKNSTIVAAILLACAGVTGCSNKEQAAYRQAALAQQELDSGDITGARIYIDKALRERDDLVELHLLKGRIELKGQSLESAFFSYSNALSLDPANQDALQSVAMLGLQSGHTNEAEEAAKKLLVLSPRNPTAQLVKGLLAIERARYPEALAAADAILANSSTDEGAVVLKARALFLSGSEDEAVQLLARTEQLAGPSPGLSRISLEIARARGDARAMLKAFAALRQQNETDPGLTFDEANVRYKTGDRIGAAQLVLAGLKRDGSPLEPTLRLLDLWREYDPAAPTAGSLNGIAGRPIAEAVIRYLIEQDRFAEALALSRVDDKNTAASNALQGLRARILVGTGQIEAGRQLAQNVAEQDATQCDARIALADIALRSGAIDSAITSSQQAAAECPQQVEATLLAARAYSASGRDIQAMRIFRDAISRNPDNVRVHAAFADWLTRNKKSEEAMGVARHIIRFAPNRISSWRLMAGACANPACRDEATKGMSMAQASLFIDRRPDEPRLRGLFASFGGGVSGK